MRNTTSFSVRLLRKRQLWLQPLNSFRWMFSFRSIYLFRFLLYIIPCLLIISCGGDAVQSSKSTSQKQYKPKDVTDSSKEQPPKIAIKRNTAIEVMDEKDIRFNGKLKRYFSFSEFQSVLGEPDSTKLLSDEEPCTNIFQEPDGSVHPDAKYLYKNGSRFEYSQGKVAIDEVKFSNGDFIVFGNVSLNKQTTLAELKRLFPNAAEHIGIMDVAGEGELQVIQLREDKNNISDGHINIFIRNGKLYSLHWWFPC